MGLFIYLKESITVVSWIFLSLVAGTGTGMLFSAQGFAAQASVSNADVPFAGQTFGVAISGVIFQNTFKFKILATPYAEYAEEWSQNASAFVYVVRTWSREGEEGIMRAAVVNAYVESLRMVWAVMCIFAGVIFVASLIWIKEISLTRELKTEQGFRYGGKKGGDEEQQQSRPTSKVLEIDPEKEMTTEVKNVTTDEEEGVGAGSIEKSLG
jgi:hypothetical protein